MQRYAAIATVAQEVSSHMTTLNVGGRGSDWLALFIDFSFFTSLIIHIVYL